MIDTDTQPTLSSYYHIEQQAPYGLYELVMRNDIPVKKLISHTEYPNLHIIFPLIARLAIVGKNHHPIKRR